MNRSLALAVCMGALVTPAQVLADFNDYDWTLLNNAGGSASVTPALMTINGGNNGTAGVVQYTANTVCVDSRILAILEYSSVDTGTWDTAYYAINGVKTVVASNANQGVKLLAFDVEAGDTFGFGVETADGQFGPGIAKITSMFTETKLGFGEFGWVLVTAPSGVGGSGSVSATNMKVTGGDAGVAGDKYYRSRSHSSMAIYAEGVYSSMDTGTFDSGFYFPPFKTTILTNENQGPWAKGFLVSPNQFFGFGVNTVDGVFGPGILDVNLFQATATPGYFPGFPFNFFTNSGGSGAITSSTMTITGGNNGTAGVSEYTVTALTDLCVFADLNYSSNDTGTWDSAYYFIGGVKTVVAANNNQGLKKVMFSVKRGQEFGFGVETGDGQFGPGIATINKYRAFIPPPVAAVCYPDCDGNKVLNIDDFLCFQLAFALKNSYADCDKNGIFNIDDFLCFQLAFALGCK